MMQHRDVTAATVLISDRAIEKRERAIRLKRQEAASIEAATNHAADNAPWYALKVDTGRETTVENTLRKAGIECLVPMRKGRMMYRRHRNIQAIIPVMIGYVLVRFERSFRAFEGVLRFDGARGFVCGEGGPLPVSHSEVKAFDAMAREGAFDWSAGAVGIKRNVHVIVAYGPFKDMKGVVVSARGDGLGDAVVDLKVEGETMSVLLPLAILKKL